MSKMDRSTKVGGRRRRGGSQPKKSVAKGPRGRKVVWPGGNQGYQKK